MEIVHIFAQIVNDEFPSIFERWLNVCEFEKFPRSDQIPDHGKRSPDASNMCWN